MSVRSVNIIDCNENFTTRLFAGGVIGSVIAALRGQGKYKSVAEIIMYDMTPSQRAKLEISIRNIIQDIKIEDVAMLAAFIMTNNSLQKAIVVQLAKFLKDEMNLSIA